MRAEKLEFYLGPSLSLPELSRAGKATPVSRLSLDREKMSRPRQLGKIVSSSPSTRSLSLFPLRMRRGRSRCRRVLAATSKNLGAACT